MNAFNRLTTCAIALSLSSLGCATAANAQVPPAPPGGSTAVTGETQPGTPAQRQASQHFVTKAAYANRAEIQEARYVVNHTANSAVKNFAQRMIHDHTLSLDQLKAIASSEGLMIPAGVSAKDQKSFDELKGQNGAALDKRYSDGEVKDHRQAIAQFNSAAKQSDLLPAVRDYASKTVPTLQQHLHLAQHLVATEAKGNHSAG